MATTPISQEAIERLVALHQLTACFECGKCTASCPLGELFPDHGAARTPRGIIERALLSADLVTGDLIWYCLTCDVCTKGCPCGVRLRDFILALRELVLESGQEVPGVRCRACERYFLPEPAWGLVREKLAVEAPPDFLFLCPGCRQRDFSRRVKAELPGRRQVRREE
jgi:Fe-S oxidoreductase